MKAKISSVLLYFCLLCHYIGEVDCTIKCKCSEHYCPDDHQNYTCTTEGNCFSQVKKVSDGIVKVMGCLPPEPSGKVSIFQCQKGKRKLEETNSVSCCSERNFCNLELKPTFKPTEEKTTGIPRTTKIGSTVIALVALTIICVLILIVIVGWYCCRQKTPDRYGHIHVKNHISSNHQTIEQIFEDANTAGSGSGLPYLVQRTIARQVHKTRKIGTGRFSCVYEAQWRGDKVAIRIFQSRDEVLWQKECSFYKDLPRDNNILAFIASDRLGNSSATELYMITEYCPHGSLYEYLNLKSHHLSRQEMLRLATSAASGLAYLHKEVTGTLGKCIIVHRNLTSKGIYVKKGGECAIGDFALALKSDCELSEKETEKNPRQASKLYMAPELLDKTLVAGKSPFALLLMADIYSLALVLWEIAFRTVSEGIGEPYQAPYYGMVSGSPSIDELRKVVCIEKKRPPILNRWHDDHVMREISNVIEECWHHSPNARLTALRIKKNLVNMQECFEGTVQIV